MSLNESIEMTSQEAFKWITSSRGRFVLAQALQAGVKELSAVRPFYLKEYSNINDMEMLLNSDFLKEPVKWVNTSREFQTKRLSSTIIDIPLDWMGEEL